MVGGPKPHDALVRRALSVPANAASQVRAVLPDAVVKRLDLGQIRQEPGSFVDPELRSRYSDLVFSVPLDGRDAFVYVLVEHQSSTDRWMPLRMLEYVVRIWDHYLKAHPEALRLPVVIPMVLHHNERAWSGATEVAELIDVDADTAEELGELVPRFRFLLDDLATVDEQDLRQRPLTPGLRFTYVLLQKVHGHLSELPDQLWPWSSDVRAMLDEPGGKQMLQAQVEYIWDVGETSHEQLQEWFAHVGPDAEEVYMTTADMLRAQGRAEGEAQGRAEGEAKGRVEGQAETLLRQLDVRFGPLSRAVIDTVRNGTGEQLETWTTRILTAETLDDALR